MTFNLKKFSKLIDILFIISMLLVLIYVFLMIVLILMSCKC